MSKLTETCGDGLLEPETEGRDGSVHWGCLFAAGQTAAFEERRFGVELDVDMPAVSASTALEALASRVALAFKNLSKA